MGFKKKIYIDNQLVEGRKTKINLVETLDKSLDFGKLTITRVADDTKYNMFDDVVIIIEDEDGAEKIFRDYVVESCRVIPENVRRTRFTKEVTLIERTKKLEYHFLTRAFTQPLTGPKFTLWDVIEDLRQTVPFQQEQYLDTTRLFQPGGSLAFLADIESPEFFFNNVTLREALDEILDTVDGVARLNRKGLSNTTPPTYPYNVLEVDLINEKGNMIDRKEKIDYSEDALNINQYATILETNASNVLNDAAPFNVGGLVYEPDDDKFGGLRSESAGFEEESLFFPITFPKLRKFEVVMEVETQTQGNQIIDITDHVLEQDERLELEWNAGNPDLYLGLYQSNTLTWDLRSNKITGWFDKFDDIGISPGSTTIIENLIKTKLVELGFALVEYNQQKAEDLLIRVAYSGFSDPKMQVARVDVDEINKLSSRTINQSGNAISTKKALSALYTEAQTSGNSEFRIARQLTRVAEMHNKGDYDPVGDYVIGIIEYSFDSGSAMSKEGFARHFQKKNERLRVNSLPEIFEIPIDERVVQRQEYYSEYMIWTFDNIPEDAGHMLTDDGQEIYANALRPTLDLSKDTPPFNVLFSDPDIKIRRNPDGSYESLAASNAILLPIKTFGGGNSLNFYFKFDSPNKAGDQVGSISTSIFTDRPILRAIRYVDEIAQLENYTVRFINGFVYPGAKNLPLVVNNPVNVEVLNPGSFRVLKKSGDVLSGNVALQSIPAYPEDIIIGDTFITRNNLVEKTNIARQLFLIRGNGRYERFENKLGKPGAVAAGSFTLTVNTAGILINVPIIDDDNWAIVDINNNLYAAVNQRKADGSFQQRTVLWIKRKINREGVEVAY